MNNNDASWALIAGVAIGAIVTLFIISMIYIYAKEIRKSNIFKYGCNSCNCKKFTFIKVTSERCHEAGSESWNEWVRKYKCNKCGAVYNVTGKVSSGEADVIWSHICQYQSAVKDEQFI